MANKYRYVNLPESLVNAIETYIKKTKQYSSIAEFVKEAVRLRLEQLQNKREEAGS